MARHGLGAERQSFAISEVLQIDTHINKTLIFTPDKPKVLPIQNPNLAEFTDTALAKIERSESLSIKFLKPLRIRQNKKLLENITFAEFFKQCSL